MLDAGEKDCCSSYPQGGLIASSFYSRTVFVVGEECRKIVCARRG